ncbi:CCA tRNA nucleotidyltransferase [Cyanobium gracile UHCC 0139]|uniref:CCA tRNA nucleotidyltransferase n=1 Tax=Cyanobium gracile UHCC 0139 TaxID=3110308 RepID=A0ABU5RNI5_9CYAN|nr:CCA tRNA nucleotidyltransferase [Cyanobium gracile]MEA5389644.1 CCA tRNA nucleotidyltransferase [Cyanobium gracile UHCC 0139]
MAPHQLPAGTALVGGAVRDGLLGRLTAQPDLDLVVPVNAIDLARRLGRQLGGSCVVLDQERSIARLVLQGWTIDLARCAGEDLTADLGRRDFTCNAIALPLDGALPGGSGAVDPRLIDPCGGLQDLAAHRLVAISEANLLDDPLRLLRGVRLACELAFSIAPATWELIRRHRQRITAVAGERVLAELERLAAAPEGHRGLGLALEAGLLQPWGGADGSGPRLEPLGPGRPQACGLTPPEAAWALPLARLAAVLDGPTLERLRASRRLQQRCQRLRHWHERLQRSAAPQGEPCLEALGEADRLQMHRQLEEDLPALLMPLDPAAARAALVRWRNPADRLFHPRPPLDGRRLQQLLAIPPGPRLGQLIDHLTAERAFGRLGGTAATDTAELNDPLAVEEAVTAARLWLNRRGPGASPDPRRD